MNFYRDYGKRVVDLALAVPALVVFAPLMAGLALLVRWRLGSPTLFRQVRPGLHGQPFRLVKFRSMTDARDAAGNLLPDAERLPPFGRFLRATSLDELPELWNVVKGDMSLVGPRPLLMEYLPLYSPEQARRHEVRPGITGWAQVNGRNALSWPDKFRLDVEYVERVSFWLDLKTLWLTVWQVVQYPEGLELGTHTDIGAFTYINARHGVTIEPEVQIGSHCSIYSVSTIDDKAAPVTLKRNCRIGSHSTVMPGVTIGENAVVGAHSFVNKDIPANTVAYGVPARVVRELGKVES